MRDWEKLGDTKGMMGRMKRSSVSLILNRTIRDSNTGSVTQKERGHPSDAIKCPFSVAQLPPLRPLCVIWIKSLVE